MRGLDTNVLIRYIVWDDKKQAQQAAECIDRIIESGSSCLINTIVLCETVWVLESAYGFSNNEIADVCEKILTTKQFEVEHVDIVRSALAEYRNGRADLADYLIGKLNLNKGCKITYTFDRALKDQREFLVL